jgi:hypothetical protein
MSLALLEKYESSMLVSTVFVVEITSERDPFALFALVVPVKPDLSERPDRLKIPKVFEEPVAPVR